MEHSCFAMVAAVGGTKTTTNNRGRIEAVEASEERYYFFFVSSALSSMIYCFLETNNLFAIQNRGTLAIDLQ